MLSKALPPKISVNGPISGVTSWVCAQVLFLLTVSVPLSQVMAQKAGLGRRYIRAFVSGFFVAVPVTVTVLDRLAYVARVDGASMQVGRSVTFMQTNIKDFSLLEVAPINIH